MHPARLLLALLGATVGLVATADDWHRDFRLRDEMRIYDFPEELVSYPVTFPPKSVRPGQLQLLDRQVVPPRSVTFQLSEVETKGGFLVRAVVSFRTDLEKGGTRRFRLQHTPGRGDDAPSPAKVTLLPPADGVAVLAANRLRVRVPAGDRFFSKPKKVSEVPAPLLAVARGEKPGDWCLAGSLSSDTALRVVALNTKLLAAGPLFAKYRVEYVFEEGLQYIVVLTVRHDERYVTIDESFGGLEPRHEVYLRLDLTPGFDPDQRSVMSNGGYHAQGYNGGFDKNTGPDGRLPFELGLNRPNSMGVMRSASFYKDAGPHALLISLYRLRDWKTAGRHVWYGNSGPGNLNFYARGKEKFLQTRLEGGRRHWALALVPREEQKHVRITPGGRGRGPAGGPEVRLWQKLGDFSLNQFKDWVFDWEETLQPRLFPAGPKVSYEQWQKAYGMEALWWFLNAIVNFHWDFSAEVGPPSYGLMPDFFGNYERSRGDWTAEQRAHVRAILLFLAYTAEDDNNLPHHSMLAGQPNFVMQVKQTMAIACGVFPNHPHAKRWRDSFVKFYKEWLEVYGRTSDAGHNALGGRWTENIACYSGTSLQAVLRCAKGLEIHDGTDLLDHPMLRDWVGWYLQSFMSPHSGARRVPPEGAHAGALAVGGPYWKDLFEIARRLKRTAPELSMQMQWIDTAGKAGRKPNLKSVLIRDYGPVFRHDFGGPREAYAHLMQLGGRYNYRWSMGHGTVYYGARDQNWSYNGSEANGDSFNAGGVSMFSVGGQGLGWHASDQPLYDFGFAQFYRAVADPKLAEKTGYLSRGLLLLRDEGLMIYDDVRENTAGQFSWNNSGQLPHIAQLLPGAVPAGDSTESARHYRGKGDFLTLVSPLPRKARRTPFGAVIGNSEYVLWCDRPIVHADRQLAFRGSVGYARAGELALFEGTELRLGKFSIAREGGDFGISAALRGRRVIGRLAGRHGGQVHIAPPVAFDSKHVKATLSGRGLPVIVDEGKIHFAVEVKQADGTREFAIDLGPLR